MYGFGDKAESMEALDEGRDERCGRHVLIVMSPYYCRLRCLTINADGMHMRITYADGERYSCVLRDLASN